MPTSIKPERIIRGEKISSRFLREVTDAIVQRLVVVNGRARRIGTNIAIEVDQTPRSSAVASTSIYVSIVSSTGTGPFDSGGNFVQWTYSVAEVEKTTVGYNGWTTKPEGFTGTAFNLLEVGNTGANRQHNGINHSSTLYTDNLFAMEPIPNESICAARLLLVPDGLGDFVTEAWITQVPNAEDGACVIPE